MIAGINDNSVDGCSGNQRIISHHRPCRGTAAAVGGFPHTAADRARIGHDTAIDGGGRIDRNRVNAPFGRRVIKAARATGHPLRLRTKRGKRGRGERQRIGQVEL